LSSAIAPTPSSPSKNTVQSEETAGESVAYQSNVIDTFDEFDPRGSASGSYRSGCATTIFLE